MQPTIPETPAGTPSATGTLPTVRRLEVGDVASWDRYVLAHPEATFFHRAGWRAVLEEAFRHRTHYFVAERGGELCGVLPLGEIRSRLFGHALFSTPFCVYGGTLASDATAESALDAAARDLAEELGVAYLEMRNRRVRWENAPRKDLYVTFRREIDPDPEVNLAAIPRKQRAMVRKGIKSGLASEIDDGIDRFYGLYAESVRNLGTPVFPRRYFEKLREVFEPEVEVLTVVGEGQPLASVLSFHFRGEVLPYYGGGGVAAREFAANDFMYWEVMRRAAERGCRLFDFGRSKRDVGSYRFKKHWGFEPEPLHYEYHLVRASAVPDLNPLNPKYRLFVDTWKKLPLAVSNRLGPLLARDLG